MKKPMNRRTFLRSAGVCLSIPFLEAMLPIGRSWAQATTKRYLAFHFPMGRVGHGDTNWTPNEVGTGYTVKPTILSPIDNLRNEVSVMTGINVIGGNHVQSTASFLTASNINHSVTDIRAARSIDQFIADQISGGTPVKSLALGSHFTQFDRNDYSRIYYNNISWASPTQPAATIIDPRIAFDQLFAAKNTGSAEEIRKMKAMKKSVLDSVLEDYNRVHASVSSQDKLKLEEYMQSVRDVEVKIDNIPDDPTPIQCELGDRPSGARSTHYKLARMVDLAVLAFQCDLTRVITIAAHSESSNEVYDFLPGVSDLGHHDLSHYIANTPPEDRESQKQQQRLINKHFVSIFADIVTRLRAIDVGGDNVLNQSFLLFGSGLAQCDSSHQGSNVPLIVGGGRSLGFEPGKHISSGGKPIANIHLTAARKLGHPMTTFGNSNGEIPGL